MQRLQHLPARTAQSPLSICTKPPPTPQHPTCDVALKFPSRRNLALIGRPFWSVACRFCAKIRKYMYLPRGPEGNDEGMARQRCWRPQCRWRRPPGHHNATKSAAAALGSRPGRPSVDLRELGRGGDLAAVPVARWTQGRGTISTAQDILAVADKPPDRTHTLNNQDYEAQRRYYIVIVRHVAATVPSTDAESTDELDESLRVA